jgi:glycosyltransferase involved in cell wall biosynthesis
VAPTLYAEENTLPDIRKWYFALSESSINRNNHGWRSLIRVALQSALDHTDLLPHMIYDGQENDFVNELRGYGVKVIPHRVSFYDSLERRADGDADFLATVSGAFLRVELPIIETEDTYVLYTDCDVLFRPGFEIEGIRPKLFACAGQTDKVDYRIDMNSGVMVMNIPNMRERLPEFIEFIMDNIDNPGPGADQKFYRMFFEGQWEELPAKYNWKPYWGENPQAKVLHWHGPKPIAVRKMLASPQTDVADDWTILFDYSPSGYATWLTEWDEVADRTRRDITCHVDGMQANIIFGWAILADKDQPASLMVEWDGSMLGVVDCTIPRRDVEAVYGRVNAGFELAIPVRFTEVGNHRLRFLDQAGNAQAILWNGITATQHSVELSIGSNRSVSTALETAGTRAVHFEPDPVIVIDHVKPSGVVIGWAIDKAKMSQPLGFHIVIDGTSVEKMQIADLPRPDVSAAVSRNIPAKCGYVIQLPKTVLDGRTRRLQIVVGESIMPFYFNNAPVEHFEFCQDWQPTFKGQIDGLVGGRIRGWVVAEDSESGTRSGQLDVLVTCDGVQIGQTRAARLRTDVSRALLCTPEVGFEFEPPPHLRLGRQHTFRFYAMPHRVELQGSPVQASFVNDKRKAEYISLVDGMDALYRTMTSLRARMRTLVPEFGYSITDYDAWARQYLPRLRAQTVDKRHASARADPAQEMPLLSVICPAYRPNIEEFTQAIESVIDQTYQNWELIVVDDGSESEELTDAVERFGRQDNRIVSVVMPKNVGISTATNSGIAAARGQWVVFFDHDDLLVDCALEVMVMAARETGAKLLYSDEDKVDETGYYCEPHLKPSWNYRLMLAVNYVCHLVMVDRKVLKKAGKLSSKLNGAQDHGLLLRISEVISPDQIHHVPEILYHWRKSGNSTASAVSAKPYAIKAGIDAVASHLRRLGKPATVTAMPDGTFYRVEWGYAEEPSVTIIIPFRDQVATTRECIERLLARTTYTNYDIILVDNWSTLPETAAYCAEIEKHEKVRVIRSEEPFNYSRLNNIAAASTEAEYLVPMNNDLFVTDGQWLRIIVNEALADDKVAIVGGKFLYPNGTVQHAGVILGLGGVAGHVHSHLAPEDRGYMGRAVLAQEMSAVTAACLLIRHDVFREVGGFDETHLQVAVNDVDLCLKVRMAGWKIIWTPDFVADHHESLSRGEDVAPSKEARFFDEVQVMKARWGERLVTDPFYNKHFALEGQPFFDLRENRPGAVGLYDVPLRQDEADA